MDSCFKSIPESQKNRKNNLDADSIPSRSFRLPGNFMPWKTSQDPDLSFEALGILDYALSMPDNWIFHPKLMCKNRDIGRNKMYERLNELISKFYCIRIRLHHEKSPNLPGQTRYEFFASTELCKERITELLNTEKFIEHGYNFKKCFRRPYLRDPENGDITIYTKIKKDRSNEQTESAPPLDDRSIFFDIEKGEEEILQAELDKIGQPPTPVVKQPDRSRFEKPKDEEPKSGSGPLTPEDLKKTKEKLAKDGITLSKKRSVDELATHILESELLKWVKLYGRVAINFQLENVIKAMKKNRRPMSDNLERYIFRSEE